MYKCSLKSFGSPIGKFTETTEDPDPETPDEAETGDTVTTGDDPVPPVHHDPPIALRRSTRSRPPPDRYSDYRGH